MGVINFFFHVSALVVAFFTVNFQPMREAEVFGPRCQHHFPVHLNAPHFVLIPRQVMNVRFRSDFFATLSVLTETHSVFLTSVCLGGSPSKLISPDNDADVISSVFIVLQRSRGSISGTAAATSHAK
jgi:hypothetical protein